MAVGATRSAGLDIRRMTFEVSGNHSQQKGRRTSTRTPIDDIGPTMETGD